MRRGGWLGFAAVLLVATAWAQPSGPATQDLDRIVREQRTLQSQVQERRGAYRDMAASDRARLLAAQSELLQLAEGESSFDTMPQDRRERIQGLLQEIRTSVARAEDERLVCRKEKRSGSHLAQTQCRTAAEIRLERENARKLTERPLQCVGETCKGS